MQVVFWFVCVGGCIGEAAGSLSYVQLTFISSNGSTSAVMHVMGIGMEFSSWELSSTACQAQKHWRSLLVAKGASVG
jgi:hypothetical protein